MLKPDLISRRTNIDKNKYLELLFLELGKLNLNIDFEIVVFETVFLTTEIRSY